MKDDRTCKGPVSKVLEVLEIEGRRVARVSSSDSFLEVSVDDIPNVHLGDLVRVSGRGKNKVVTPVSEADLPESPRSKQ